MLNLTCFATFYSNDFINKYLYYIDGNFKFPSFYLELIGIFIFIIDYPLKYDSFKTP